MTKVSIDIPDLVNPRVIAAVHHFGPQFLQVMDGSSMIGLPLASKDVNDWTKSESLAVLKLMISRFVVDLVKQLEMEQARESAAQVAASKVDMEVVIT